MERSANHVAAVRNEAPLSMKELKFFAKRLGESCEILELHPADRAVSPITLSARHYINAFEKALTNHGHADAIAETGHVDWLEGAVETISDLKKKRDAFAAEVIPLDGILPESANALKHVFDSTVAELEKNRSNYLG